MIAYNATSLINLSIVKEAKRWLEAKIISRDQFTAIADSHKADFYHPNFIIRILLFIATLIALGGVTGFFGLILMEILEDTIEAFALIYGIGSWFFLEMFFVKSAKHYKSGVNEALLYHSLAWTIGGLAALTNFQEDFMIICCIVLFSIAAIRYADLICTFAAFVSFAGFVFYEFYSMGGIYEQIIPIVFLIVLTPCYFVIRKLKAKQESELWTGCLMLLESLTLLTIYAAGNYFVVRELSSELMGLVIEPGHDIPFAILFYCLTVLIPLTYLYFGIKNKDVVLLRVSLVVLAFSVFTFKYYFSLGHPEVTLTLAGATMLTLSLYVFRYLKTPKHGFSRENLLKEKWADANPEAFIMSQTLGGNKVTMETPADIGGGGQMSGGGSSDGW